MTKSRQTVICFLTMFAIQITAFGQSDGAKKWSAADDHRNMMEQLGIKALRPGPSGNESAPNHANYDESTANPFPDYPEILRLKSGTAVTTADMWWRQRDRKS